MKESTWWGEDIVPRIRWQIEVKEGEIIPDGYGIAWHRYEANSTVCMPIGLHAFVGSLRHLYMTVRFWHLGPTVTERMVRDARFQGRRQSVEKHVEAAYLKGWEAGIKYAIAQINDLKHDIAQ
jgi:hypothetical protein